MTPEDPNDWAPMPRGNETLYGLRRGKLYTLAVPCAANGFNPPVLSKSVPGPEKKGAKKKRRTGSRFVCKSSLWAYINADSANAGGGQ